MEDWPYYTLCVTLCLALSYLVSSRRRRPATGKPSLPPGPTGLSLIGPFLFLGWTSNGIELIVRAARSWYGPVFTLNLPPHPVVFVADGAAARRALVQGGAAFADRPPPNLTGMVFSSNRCTVTSAPYGPLWRALRRNLTGKALHPSCLARPHHAAARRDAARDLVAGVARQMRDGGDGVVVVEGLLHRAMLHVFARMCFGEGLGDDGAVASVAALQREFLTSVIGFQVFGVAPAVTKLVFRRRWEKMMCIRRRQEELFIPLIRGRRDAAAAGGGECCCCYADSLLGLGVPDDGGGGSRSLTEPEMVSLCNEFLSGGTDSTVAVMQWAMANLVAWPAIQAKLRAEIHDAAVVSGDDGVLLHQPPPTMPYLRAVVLETLRRHPPARVTLPHAASEEGGATLDGFTVPRHVAVYFAPGGMAMDGAVWPEPAEFRPERFLPGGGGEDVDLAGGGGKEEIIKMMPFGAGRRMCPGVGAALLHVEYLVANLVREFEWKEVPGEPVDFAERQTTSVVMRRPLRAKVVPCRHNL